MVKRSKIAPILLFNEADGIMIATTNLQQNLDKAFERRFLYKIRFDKPTAEARACIWREMIPDIDNSVVSALSEKYDFSGGQIENIARKYSINSILHGDGGNLLEMLVGFGKEELLDAPSRRKIGF